MAERQNLEVYRRTLHLGERVNCGFGFRGVYNYYIAILYIYLRGGWGRAGGFYKVKSGRVLSEAIIPKGDATKPGANFPSKDIKLTTISLCSFSRLDYQRWR